MALDADLTGAVDVFDTEPTRHPADPFLAHPNLICMPHIGFATDDEFDRQFADIFVQINAFAANEPINTINPEVLPPAAGGRPPAR